MALGADVWVAVALGLPLLLLAWILYYSHSLSSRVAPGSGGVSVPLEGRFWQLPLLGESIQFLRSSPDDFMLPRIGRYGPIFRTHLFGSPLVCVTNAEAVKFVLQSPKLFKASYPITSQQLFGKDSISIVDGQVHSRYRSLILPPLTPEVLKHFTVKVDHAVKGCLQRWAASLPSGPLVINTGEEVQKLTFQVVSLFTCHTLSPVAASTQELRATMVTMEKGLIGLPLPLPGTAYKKAIAARKWLVGFLGALVGERRANSNSNANGVEESTEQSRDLIDSFLKWEKDGEKLTVSQMVDNLLFVILAGYNTTAVTITWLIQNLCTYPHLFREIKAENDAVAKRRASVDDPVTWEDLQQLTLTQRFIQETLRTANVVPFTLRTASEDVIYNGMLIPKGWKLLLWFRYSHLDSTYFSEPHKFDPDRFKSVAKANTFTPFGNGNRVCPGSELAKMESMLFLHRLIESFDFEAAGEIDRNVAWWPIPRPADGMPIRITERSS